MSFFNRFLLIGLERRVRICNLMNSSFVCCKKLIFITLGLDDLFLIWLGLVKYDTILNIVEELVGSLGLGFVMDCYIWHFIYMLFAT